MKNLLFMTGSKLSTACLAHMSTLTISSSVGSAMKSALCFSITISTAAGIPNDTHGIRVTVVRSELTASSWLFDSVEGI